MIAEREGAPVGASIVGDRPRRGPAIGARELSIELLISSRRTRATRSAPSSCAAPRRSPPRPASRCWQVDCWAAAPTLVACYERRGFVRAGVFDYDGWIG